MLAAGRSPGTASCSPACLQGTPQHCHSQAGRLVPVPVHRRQRRCSAVRAQETANLELKRPPRWDIVFGQLTDERDLQSLDPRDAWQQAQKGKLVLVDVRPKARYEEAHPPGAQSAQLYRKTDFSQFSFQRYFKAAALMANGIEPVEPNPSFMAELKAASGGKPICLMCEMGGSLAASPSFPTGKVSRSLLAAYQAFELGNFPEVYHLKGGAYGWNRAGLPFDGDYSTSGSGRTPNVVSEDEREEVETVRDVQSGN